MELTWNHLLIATVAVIIAMDFRYRLSNKTVD